MSNIPATIEVIEQAMAEIRNLRHENEILKAKVSVMELFRQALNPMYATQGEAMQVDQLWIMEKHLDELKQINKVNNRLTGIGKANEAMANAQAGAVQAAVDLDPKFVYNPTSDPDAYQPIF
jgi:hypothetical protein